MKINELKKEEIFSKNQNSIFYLIMQWYSEKHFDYFPCNYSQFKFEDEHFNTEVDFLEFEKDLKELKLKGYVDFESISDNSVTKLITTDKADRLWNNF
jgi:hypothetical protein